MLPKDFPPYTTVQRYFYRWRDDGRWEQINHVLMMQAREAEGREASPSAGIIDSQSVKTTEAGGPRGFDAGKKVKGRKRHILTDTMGLLVGAIVHAADIQDRDGAVTLLASIRSNLPWLRHVFADAAYAGDKLERALTKLGTWTLEIVRRADAAKGFVLLPRRWVVERTIALTLSLSKGAQSKSSPRQGLRGDHRERARVADDRQRQTPLAQARQSVMPRRGLRVILLAFSYRNQALPPKC